MVAFRRFFFEESAGVALHRAVSAWSKTATFLAGLAAAGFEAPTVAGLTRARADKIALLRERDSQEQTLANEAIDLTVGGRMTDQEGLAAPDVGVARQVATLHHELGDAREQLRVISQENSAILHQLETARSAAENLVQAAQCAGSVGGAARENGPTERSDFASRYEAAANALSSELGRSHHGLVVRAVSLRTRVADDGSIGAVNVADGDDVLEAEEEALGSQRVQLEAILVVQREEVAAATDAVGLMERRLLQLQGGCERSALVCAQQALDEANSALSDAELAADGASSKLATINPRLRQVNGWRSAIRHRVEAALPGLRPCDVASLADARAIIGALLPRSRAANSRPPTTGAVDGDIVVLRGERLASEQRGGEAHSRRAREELEALKEAIDSGAADETTGPQRREAPFSKAIASPGRPLARPDADRGREVRILEARHDELQAELELGRQEKRRLEQLVDDMKHGNLRAVFERAQEDAEKEVLRRMLSTQVTVAV